MKHTIIIVTLLIAGCTEQATDIKRHPSLSAEKQSAQSVYIDDGCQQVRDFAAWCQKAHPEVWREYHSTTTEGR